MKRAALYAWITAATLALTRILLAALYWTLEHTSFYLHNSGFWMDDFRDATLFFGILTTSLAIVLTIVSQLRPREKLSSSFADRIRAVRAVIYKPVRWQWGCLALLLLGVAFGLLILADRLSHPQ